MSSVIVPAYWRRFIKWKETLASVMTLMVSWVNWDVNMFLMNGNYSLIPAKQTLKQYFYTMEISHLFTHAVVLKETYKSMETLLKLIRYADHRWNPCGDVKVVALLLGLQFGYTKYMCFFCLWNSHDDANHYRQKQWPDRDESVSGRYNVKHWPLVPLYCQKVYLPPIHIKLGIMKNFVKALDKKGEAFQYIQSKFVSEKSEAKIKEGIFVGPKISKLILHAVFKQKLYPVESAAWEAFMLVIQNFLGNHRSDNCVELVENMLTAYQVTGARMSLKMHFLHSHLDFFHPIFAM